jgi:hypothetical protein
MKCGYILTPCGKCGQTTCPEYPEPVPVGDCAACGNLVYRDDQHYLIGGELVHYDCLHAYHVDDLVREELS